MNPFRFQAAVEVSEPAPSRPPSILIAVTNMDDSVHILTTADFDFPFPTAQATNDGDALVLESSPPSTRDGECWSAVPSTLPMIAGHRFDPGETVEKRYAVLNAEDSDTCWPPGAYEFVQEYALDPNDETTLSGGTAFTWGFTVVVRENQSIAIE